MRQMASFGKPRIKKLQQQGIKRFQYGKHQQDAVYDITGIAPTIAPGTHASGSHLLKINVSGQSGPMISTNTPAQSTAGTTGTKSSSREISEQLTLPLFPMPTCSLAGFLAKLSVLLESAEDSKTQEALCSLKSAESFGLKELSIYSLKMFRACSATRKAIPSRSSSNRWMSWGMTVNGACLTARASGSRSTGTGCLLRDILEKDPAPKYFLSKKAIERIMSYSQKDRKLVPLRQEEGKPGQTELTSSSPRDLFLLKVQGRHY